MKINESEITGRLKRLIVQKLNLKIDENELKADQPLFGPGDGSLGLDSVEALEIAVSVEEEFGVRIDESEEVEDRFYSVSTLSAYILELLEANTSSK